MEEEDVFDDDYDPNAQGFGQDEDDDGFVPEDQLDPEEGIDDEEIDDEEIEEVVEDQLEEEPDEEMHDRGTYRSITVFLEIVAGLNLAFNRQITIPPPP